MKRRVAIVKISTTRFRDLDYYWSLVFQNKAKNPIESLGERKRYVEFWIYNDEDVKNKNDIINHFEYKEK